jgi:hypothetical protein
VGRGQHVRLPARYRCDGICAQRALDFAINHEDQGVNSEAVISEENVVRLTPRARILILPVLDADFDKYLPRCMEILAPAVARQSQNASMQDIEDSVREGTSLMWAIHVGDTLVAALTTCVVKHPQRLTLRIEFMAGSKMSVWMNDAMELLEKLARDAGLSAVEADGRKGFERYLGRSKFREAYRNYVMEID